MRSSLHLLVGAAFAASLSIAAPMAYAEDDDENGWFEGQNNPSTQPAPQQAEEEDDVVVERRPARGTRVVVVDGEGEREIDPRRLRNRRGRLRRVVTAHDGETPPPGYRAGWRSRRNLWIPGVTLLAGGYLASALSSTAMLASEAGCFWECRQQSHDWGWGFLPLVGPYFISADSSIDTGWRVAYGIFGVAQDLGLILTVTGAASKRPVFIYSGTAEAPKALEPQVQVGAGNVQMKMAF